MHSDPGSLNHTSWGRFALLAACVAITACRSDVPTGQVIAQVHDQDVTISEFAFEAGRQPATPPTGADTAVLEAIARRKVFAHIAEERGLEQEPQYHFELRRAREALLSEALYRQLEGEVAAPSGTEVDAYIAAHPWKFAERRLLILQAGSGRTVREKTIDTASFAAKPPFPIMQISLGEKMRWQGEVHEVLEVRPIGIPLSDMKRWASDRMKAEKTDEKLEKLFARVLENGQLQYAPGYGPSGTQLRSGM